MHASLRSALVRKKCNFIAPLAFIHDLLIAFAPFLTHCCKGKRVCLNTIEMSNVQIIKIDLHAITISMYLDVDWNDDRLSIINGSQSIYLGSADQKILWAPEIVIGTNMVSRTIEKENFILKKDNIKGALACKRFILSTTVKCEMDFKKFPFDKHVCNLEVGTTNLELHIYQGLLVLQGIEALPKILVRLRDFLLKKSLKGQLGSNPVTYF